MIPPFTMRDRDEVYGSIFLSAIFLLIASAVVWTIRYELRVRWWLRQHPMPKAVAKGTVIDITEDTEFCSMRVRYRFTDVRGQVRESSQTFLRLRFPEALREAKEISIAYHPSQSRLSYIEGYLDIYKQRETGYIYGLMSCAAFAGGFYYFFMRD